MSAIVGTAPIWDGMTSTHYGRRSMLCWKIRCVKNWKDMFNGHFIVSRKRVLARPRRIYEYLKELVDAREDNWIHSEPEPNWFEKDKGKSMPSNPKFGHTLERLWHVIFNCSNPAQLVDCDVRGMKAEGPGGCTCKDV